nr:AraC family transcriptional regulator [Neorhizobium sp. JUb45]
MENAMDELRSIVMRAESRWTATGIPRVSMVRSEACSDQVYEPMLHVVLQGRKTLSVGTRVLRFYPASYFVVPVHLPAIGQVSSDDAGGPFLAVSLALDPSVIASVLGGDGGACRENSEFVVSNAGPDHIDAWLRMMRLIDHPDDIAMLAPMIEREILFRVSQGPQGDMLRQIARGTSRMSQIRRTIDWIREHFAETIRSEALATLAGMSVPAFYRHFAAMTAMTPIQYQKKLRLLQARRLMLFEQREATAVAFAVGYESASQFSREYARMFGLPPIKDMARFKVPEARESTDVFEPKNAQLSN